MKRCIAVMMILALILSGCGGKTDTATGYGANTASQATVKIGMTLPMTGDAYSSGRR